jgi:hypothetical protein
VWAIRGYSVPNFRLVSVENLQAVLVRFLGPESLLSSWIP